MSIISFKKRGSNPLDSTPGLDSLAYLILAPVLAPVDIFLTWIRLHKEAEEARRRNFIN